MYDLPQVLAYYISLLKTLSLRLNQHTVHLFYNEVRQGVTLIFSRCTVWTTFCST